MPKIVDHDERRREVADAVLRVVARRGVAGVTLNEVAAESGWSRGVLTHYFDNKQDLLEAALREGMQVIARNIKAGAADPDVRRALRRVLEEILPVDARRLAFSRVYVAFMAEAIVAEHLQEYFGRNHAAWRSLLAEVIDRGRAEGRFAATIDPPTTAEALGAATEGLRTRALFEVDLTPRRQQAKLAKWIDMLLPVGP